VNKRRTIALLFGALFLAGCAVFLLCAPSTKLIVKGHLKPEDPAAIRRAVSRYRRTHLRLVYRYRDFFTALHMHLLTDPLREVASLDQDPLHAGESDTNSAYVIAFRDQTQYSFKFYLEHGTNGWTVVEPVVCFGPP
jgi:hypothetical protein